MEMGEQLMPELYEAEVRYLYDMNGHFCVDDVIQRRTQLSSQLKGHDHCRLQAFMQSELVRFISNQATRSN